MISSARRYGIALLGGAALLSGCMPAYRLAPEQSQVEAPSAWIAASSEATVVDSAWWKAYGDPALSAAVEAALARNTDILSAATRIERARAELQLADSSLGPSLSFDTGAHAERALGPSGMAISRAVQPALQLNWELDLWGRLSSQAKAAELKLSATQADYDAIALSVAAETARTYIGLLSLDAQLQQAQATSSSRAEALRLAQEKFEAGYISQLELTQAESELEAVEQHIPQLKLAISRHHNALRLLSGELPAAYEQNTGSTLAALLLPAPGPGLPSELLRRRPDIARAELDLASKDASMAASRAAFLPQVSLSARAGALYVSALSYDPTKIWSLGGSILAPIFDRGRLQAQFDSATAQRDEAAFAYRGVALKAFSEVENALAGQQRFAEELSHVTARRDVLKRSLEHARNRYEAGYASYLEQLDAQRNLYQAEVQVIAVRESQLQNMVDLYKAVGGGWEYDKAVKPGL
ncbi:efflux transporter outer membrane subunit [Alcaligenes sp. SORT26]|uniref:efflux transporter outer membrane subunit n=1 Tax=Alcaligenes sp. SORT26 TaxID=2813780 RepID=UPI001A9D7266|nr:efflux transporter outer membrane subunit [Alcaligenes sp. SORT26]QTC01430.1 efflux transporter outer membrane subunit [Alcaligenes sp. SORT26]